MKLIADEYEFLRVAQYATSKPYLDVSRLVHARLVTLDSGRFGEYVKITDAGRKMLGAPKTPESDAGPEATEASEGKPKRGASGRRNTAKQTTTSSVASSIATAPSDAAQAGAIPTLASVPKAAQASAARRAEAKASGATPNAVRVRAGARVTYYPIASFKSIRHGEKQRVVTSNKLFKPYPVASSAGDVVVP